MGNRPTCEELEQKVEQLEKEVQDRKGMEEALNDYIAYQSVLAVLRGVGPEQTEEVLLQTFLLEIVKQYGFCMSWYGLYRSGEIRPILSAGRVDRYLDNLVLEIREPTSPDAQCAVSQAILKAAPFTYADLERDEGFRQWRDYALELGYRSNLALPLEVDGQVEGGMMVYADTLNAFPEERIQRLQLLAWEIGAILRGRRMRQRAEEALQRSRDELEIRVEERTGELSRSNALLKQEIAERKHAEEALRESEERLKSANRDLQAANRELEEAVERANQMAVEAEASRIELNQIFQTAADGMRVTDKDFNVLRINETFASISGTSEAEAVGKKCYEVFPCPTCHTPQCQLSRILGGDERVECEVEQERSDGTKVLCRVTAARFLAPDGDLIGIVENFRDITELKQMEQERLHREKLQGVIEMAGAVCHELNQPMQAVSGYSELLMADIPEDNPVNRDIDEIRAQILRMGEITKKLTRITRYETRDYIEGRKIIDIDKASGESK